MTQYNKKPCISPSQIELYNKCGEQYRRRYICKEVIPPQAAALRGTSIHKSAQHNFQQKIESHQDLKPKKIVDYAITVFEEKLKHDDVWLNPEEEARGKSIVILEAKGVVVSLTELFAKQVAKLYQPVMVEATHRIPMRDSDQDLLGKLDLVDDQERIVEFKSRTRKTNQLDADSSTQLTFYAGIYQAVHKKPPKDILLQELVQHERDPKDSAESHLLKTSRDRDDFTALSNQINATIKGIKAGVFMPASRGSWFCSRKWCGWWTSCPFVNNKRAIIDMSNGDLLKKNG